MSTPEKNEKYSADPAAQAAIERGMEYWNKQDFETAIKEFSEAVRLDHGCAEAYLNRGWAYHRNDDDDNAIRDCSEAIRLDPGYADAYVVRAASYGQKEDYDNVIKDCGEAIKLIPNYSAAYFFRAKAFYHTGDYDNAIKDCSERIRLTPNCKETYCYRADARHEKKQYAKAFDDYTEALRLDPDYAYAAERLNRAMKSVEAVEAAKPKGVKKIVTISVLLLLAALGVYSLLLPVRPQQPRHDYDWFTADSKADTFRISSAEELAGLAAIVNNFLWNIKPFDLKAGKIKSSNFKDKTVILAGNIDLSGYCRENWYFVRTAEGGKKVKGWVPIGTGKFAFLGTFDGNGKTISGLHIDGPESVAGLFGYVGGAVKNLSLQDINISAADYVGGVAGIVADGGTVSNCHTAGTISGNEFVGGVAGYVGDSSSVADSYSSAAVSGNDAVGGVAGWITRGSSVANSYSAYTVSGSKYVGGVAGGVNDSSTVTDSYSTGTVSGAEYVGGVVGWLAENSSVAGSYFTGTVSGNETIGGVAVWETENSDGSARGWVMALLYHLYTFITSATLWGIALGIVLGFTVHEYCHALCARKFGDNTAFYLGRVTLNPTKHFSLLGLLFLIVIGVGWAKPVEINLKNLRKPRRDFALLSAAGPFSNLVLGVMLALYLKAFVYCGHQYGLYNSFYYETACDILWWAALINIGMFILNMLPLPPLDGGNIALSAINLKPKSEEWVRIICVPILLLFVITLIVQGFIGITIIPFFQVVVEVVELIFNIGVG